MKERKRKFDDLPPRSDPNYMSLYRKKNKDRMKELGKNWRKKQIEENPNFYKDKYDQQYQLNYYQNNRKKLLENNWTKRGIEGMTYELFLSEIEKQENKCNICDKEMKLPQVDHCHKTGKYRALLCVPCNNGLGVFELYKDKFEEYLKNFKNE